MNCSLSTHMLVVIISLGSFATVSAIAIPILKLEPGTRYDQNSVGGQVKLEVFLDLHCPDSRAAWPHLKKVATKYGSSKIDLIVHQFPLPYHPHAHLASQGFYLVRDFVNHTAAFAYMSDIMDKWYMYTEVATERKTGEDVKNLLAYHASNIFGDKLTAGQFKSFIGYYKNPIAYAWKYAVRRGVAGTPWYFINGVDLGISNPLKDQDLRALLSPLVS